MKHMKKTLKAILLTAALAVCCCVPCGATDATSRPLDHVQMTARIDRIGEKIEVTVIESPYMSGVFWVITPDVTVYLDREGNAISRDALRVGDTVEISYGGQVMMSYPPQIVAARIVLQ